MRYREKKKNESWNQFLINIFRESGAVNFVDFLDKYFKDEKNSIAYREGISTEKKDVVLSAKEEEKKVVFAKKPERLKANKGKLF